MRAGRRAVCTIVVLAFVQGGPTIAYQAEVQRYYDSMREICRTGVTPVMTAAWVQAREALEAARYGGGRDNNFAGIKSPTDTWLDCFQSPGDGKE